MRVASSSSSRLSWISSVRNGIPTYLDTEVLVEERQRVLVCKSLQRINETQRQNPVILVIDDDMDYCETLSVLLCGEGYEVVCTDNGREALDYLNHSTVSLIILDLMMPMMGGWESLDSEGSIPD